MLKMWSPCSWKTVHLCMHVTSRATVWSGAPLCASFCYVMRNYIRTHFSAGQAQQLGTLVYFTVTVSLSFCAPCLSSVPPSLQASARWQGNVSWMSLCCLCFLNGCCLLCVLGGVMVHQLWRLQGSRQLSATAFQHILNRSSMEADATISGYFSYIWTNQTVTLDWS